MKTLTTQLCLLSPFTTSPTSKPRKPLREERERKREVLWLKTKTLQLTPLEDISSLTELQVTPGSPTVLTSQWKFKIAAKRNTFSPPAGAHQLTWQWRLSRLLQEPLYRFALSQTGDDPIYVLVQIHIQRSEAQFSRKKHPVVPEQYARVIGLGEPIVGSGVLWAFFGPVHAAALWTLHFGNWPTSSFVLVHKKETQKRANYQLPKLLELLFWWTMQLPTENASLRNEQVYISKEEKTIKSVTSLRQNNLSICTLKWVLYLDWGL